MGDKRKRQGVSAVEERAASVRVGANGRQRTSARPAADPGWSGSAKEIAAAVLGHLRANFAERLNEQDFEDLAQDALLELYKREVSGEQLGDMRAYAKRVAWRDARDLLRDRCVVPRDPQDRLFTSVEDRGGDPEARVIVRADLARAIEAAERLSPEQQLVYRSRFVEQLKPRETCRKLGLHRQTYYTRLRSAVSAVQETLQPDRFSLIERELLSAYVAGTSTVGERRRARRLLAADPHAAALARELRDLHQGAAAALPVPAIDQGMDLSIVDRVAGAFGGVRDRIAGLGGDHGAEQVAAQLSTSGAARAGGAGAGGVMAQLGLAGGAGKIVASCVATGVAATICVATGVVSLPGLGRGDEDPSQAASGRAEHDSARAGPPSNPDLVQAASKSTAAKSAPDKGAAPGADRTPEATSVSPAVQPSTPPVEQEFGVASAAPSSSPASAPGGAASQRDVQQEFGP